MNLPPNTDIAVPAAAQQQAMDRMYRLQRHVYDAHPGIASLLQYQGEHQQGYSND